MTFAYPVSPPIGSMLELLRAGERHPIAAATITRGGELQLVLAVDRVPADVDGCSLRWWDDDDAAWEVSASIGSWDPATSELTVELIDGWRPAVLRRAARITIDRAPIELVESDGEGRVARRTRAICLDLSTTGCRVAGAGSIPEVGALVSVVAAPVRVDARVVQVVTAAFGGWHAGLEFLPRSSEERADLVAWRDRATRAM